jgi:hypothetical protein
MPITPDDKQIIRILLTSLLNRQITEADVDKVIKAYNEEYGIGADRIDRALSKALLIERQNLQSKTASSDNVNRVVDDLKNKLDKDKK